MFEFLAKCPNYEFRYAEVWLTMLPKRCTKPLHIASHVSDYDSIFFIAIPKVQLFQGYKNRQLKLNLDFPR